MNFKALQTVGDETRVAGCGEGGVKILLCLEANRGAGHGVVDAGGRPETRGTGTQELMTTQQAAGASYITYV